MPTYLKPRVNAAAYQPAAQEMAAASNIISMLTGDLALNVVTPTGIFLPRGAVVHDVIMHCTDMDSGTALVFDVGTAANPDAFIDGTTIGQTGGTIRAGNVAGASLTMAAADAGPLTVETEVIITAATAAGTAVAGTIKIAVLYTVE